MSDRYADAVRARRAELRAALAELDGAHRAELRSELALARIAASDAAIAALSRLAREARAYVESAGPAGRRRLPALLGDAVDALAVALHSAAHLGAALRRIAGRRGLELGPDWPRLPGPRLPVVVPVPPDSARHSLLAGAVEGVALWRVALVPLAVLPLLGLPALGGPRLAPLAVGLGLAGLILAVRHRRAAADRAALYACAVDTLGSARAAIEADLGRRLLELERTLGAELDRAAARRRCEIEAELGALAPDRQVEVSDA